MSEKSVEAAAELSAKDLKEKKEKVEEKASRKERKKEVVEVRKGHLPAEPPAAFLGAPPFPDPAHPVAPPSGPSQAPCHWWGWWAEAQGQPDHSLFWSPQEEENGAEEEEEETAEDGEEEDEGDEEDEEEEEDDDEGPALKRAAEEEDEADPKRQKTENGASA
nr:parathymosin [Camelus dromedarius]